MKANDQETHSRLSRLFRWLCITILVLIPVPLGSREAANTFDGACPLASVKLCEFFDRAERGDAEANRQIGLAYLTGSSVRQDEAEAARWLRRAAEAGSAQAQTEYADLLLHSEISMHGHTGLTGQASEAASWFARAAERGDARAQTQLGLLYAQGRGVPRNVATAVTWFRRSAEQGYPAGQYNMAVAHELGDGVVRDLAAAQSWYRRAAIQGDVRAMVALGARLTAQGQSSENLEEGYAWLLVAEERGEGEATAQLDAVNDRLSHEQHDRAAIRAAEIAAQVGSLGGQINHR